MIDWVILTSVKKQGYSGCTMWSLGGYSFHRYIWKLQQVIFSRDFGKSFLKWKDKNLHILKSEKKRYFGWDTPLQFCRTVLVDKRRRKSGASGKNKNWRGLNRRNFTAPQHWNAQYLSKKYFSKLQNIFVHFYKKIYFCWQNRGIWIVAQFGHLPLALVSNEAIQV